MLSLYCANCDYVIVYVDYLECYSYHVKYKNLIFCSTECKEEYKKSRL